MQDLVGHGKDFGFYPKCSRKLLWGFTQKNDMTRLYFLKITVLGGG